MMTNQLGQRVHLQNIQLPWGITIPGLKGKACFNRLETETNEVTVNLLVS